MTRLTGFYHAVQETQRLFSKLSIPGQERGPAIEDLRQSISDLSFLDIHEHFMTQIPTLISDKEAASLFPWVTFEGEAFIEESKRIVANYERYKNRISKHSMIPLGVVIT